ncbi:MAG: four helix bundle protein [Bacteroidales bacterium]|nr:four helix bundle protein [Bacteroidales bacterium]
MSENIIRIKSMSLAKEIVFIYQYLSREKNEYILSKQLLRAGTSVGANISEGIAGQSKRDFRHKMSIAYKEARETYFWLELLRETGYLSVEKVSPGLKLCDEVIRLLFTILKTSSQTK